MTTTESIASDIEKGGITSHHENLDPVALTEELDPEHHKYLILRHGSVQLDPLPSADPEDPLNWPD